MDQFPKAKASVADTVPSQLLNRDSPEDYLQQWTAYVATKTIVTKPGTQSVVVFRINQEWMALPTHLLQEVVEHCVVRTLPHQRGGIVRGLINVRGDLLLCVSLPAMLGTDMPAESQPAATMATGGRVLILNREGGHFAFPVHAVHGVHRFHPSELRPVPATLPKSGEAAFIKEMLPWGDKTVACLDGEMLAAKLTRGLA